jgi:GxxExxY protein
MFWGMGTISRREVHRTQFLNHLKATGLHLCLLLNFGKPRLEIKRIVLDL